MFGRRTPAKTPRQQSRTSQLRRYISARSPSVLNQSLNSPSSISEYACNTTLPGFVLEAISALKDFPSTTVRIGDNGWSWLIQGTRMLVWSHQHAASGNTGITPCIELKLPMATTCALTHIDEDLSTISVTSEGNVYYWKNINTSSVQVDITGEIFTLGHIPFQVQPIAPRGYVVVTTTGSLFYVKVTEDTITYSQIQMERSSFFGIGRRVSALFFTPATCEKKVVKLVSSPVAKLPGSYDLLLLSDASLQWLRIATSVTGNHIDITTSFEVGIDETLRQKVHTSLGIEGESTIEALDVSYACKKSYIALLLSVTTGGSTKLAVCLVNNSQEMNMEECGVFVVQNAISGSPNASLVVEETKTLPFSFAISTNNDVILKTTDGSRSNEDVIKVETPDKVLSTGCFERRFLYITALKGMKMCVSSALPPQQQEIFTPTKNPSAVNVVPTNLLSRSEQFDGDNKVHQLQSAFLTFCRLKKAQAHKMIADNFPDTSTMLDESVVIVSTNLLDDQPACDPRWAQNTSTASQRDDSGGSLILSEQLRDKQSAHNLLLDFLKEVGVWDRLSYIPDGAGKLVTKSMLCSHAEKLATALVLWQKFNTQKRILDNAVEKVLLDRGTYNYGSTGPLTNQDLFFREVSKIDEIFPYIYEEQEKSLTLSGLEPRDRLNIITGMTALFEKILLESHKYRTDNAAMLEDVNFIPWTAVGHNMRNIVIKQHGLLLERGLTETSDGNQLNMVYNQLASLSDALLDDYQYQTSNDDVKQEFDQLRLKLIQPLSSTGKKDLALSLAEKHQDYLTLLEICQSTGNDEKFISYMENLKSSPDGQQDQGFATFVFNYYYDNGYHEKLLNCCDGSESEQLQIKLSEFLTNHPKLAWMHQIKRGDLTASSATLLDLAAEETEKLANKKTYLSLGKLAAVWADEDPEDDLIEEIDSQQTMIEYQETLPLYLLEQLDLKYEEMPVFTPEKLLELYIGDDNVNANEVDFKKAFELTTFMQDRMQAHEYKLLIWCRAILRDSWNNIDPNVDPFDKCSHTLLFKLIKLCYTEGLLPEIVPEADELVLRDEISALTQNVSFEYFIRASLERITRLLV